MSRYVLTEEQLNRVQDQILQLKKLYQDKEDQLKNIELHKEKVSNSKIPDLIYTIEKLEEEVKDLKEKNNQLSASYEEAKYSASKIKDMELLLEEERKLREYAEIFAHQVEVKLQEESLLKDLSLELCKLRREEIEITNKQLQETKKKMKKSPKEMDVKNAVENKENRPPSTSRSYSLTDPHLKAIIFHLHNQLVEMYNDVREKPVKSADDERHKKELEKWLEQIKKLLNEAKTIETLKQELEYLKLEIESRKKSYS